MCLYFSGTPWNTLHPALIGQTHLYLGNTAGRQRSQPLHSQFGGDRASSVSSLESSRPSKHESKLNFFSPSASSGSQNSNESCGNLSNYVLFFCQLMLNAFGVTCQCQAGGLVGRKMKNPIIIITQLSMQSDVKVLTFQKGWQRKGI